MAFSMNSSADGAKEREGKGTEQESVSSVIGGIGSPRLEINEKGQSVLPFSRRVIDTGFSSNRSMLPPIIERREQPSITIVDRRPRRFTYNSLLQDYHRRRGNKESFTPEDVFQSFVHRRHSDDYDRDEEDEDDTNEEVSAESDSSSLAFMDDLIKRNRARLGLPAPKDWDHPFKEQ